MPICILPGTRPILPTHCDDCVDRADRAHALDRRKTEHEARAARWKETVCPWPRYHGIQPALLPAPAAALFERVMTHDVDRRGLGLIGPSRTGKSMLAHALAHRLHMAGRDVHITFATQFAMDCAKLDDQAEVKRCCRAEILLFDDVDKCKFTNRVEADLFHVLEMRDRMGLPLIVTLNAKGDQLREKLSESTGDGMVNRLRDLCEFVTVAPRA